MQDWVFRLGKKLQIFLYFWKQTFRNVNLRKSILLPLRGLPTVRLGIRYSNFTCVNIYSTEILFGLIWSTLVAIIQMSWFGKGKQRTERQGFIQFSWQPPMQLNSVTRTELRQFVISSQNPPHHRKLASVLGRKLFVADKYASALTICGRQICFSLNFGSGYSSWPSCTGHFLIPILSLMSTELPSVQSVANNVHTQ